MKRLYHKDFLDLAAVAPSLGYSVILFSLLFRKVKYYALNPAGGDRRSTRSRTG